MDILFGPNLNHNTYHYNMLANLVIKLFLTYNVIPDKILLTLPVDDKQFEAIIILHFCSKYVINRWKMQETYIVT